MEQTRISSQSLQGRRLIIARTIWIIVTCVNLIVLIMGVPGLFIKVQTPCLDLTRATCGYLQLFPAQMADARSLGISPVAYATYAIIFDILGTLSFFLIGALIFWHKSNDWMGLFVSGLLITFGGLGGSLVHEQALPGISSSTDPLSLIYNFVFIFSAILTVLIWPALGLFFCTFPDGRLIPRWSWIFPCLFVVQFGFYILPPPWNFDNWPLPLQWLESWVVLGGSVGTQIYRFFCVASPLQRQQIKWLAFGFGLDIFILLPIKNLLPMISSLHSLLAVSTLLGQFLDWLPIPLALGIALLRYRLWDIDRVINRTMVYGLLTLILVGIYFGLVFGVQTLFVGLIGKSGEIVIVGSTLIVAMLFQPLRRGIQNGIDQRFYRKKYDAQRTLLELSSTLRQEVEMERLCEHIVGVVQGTMQPTRISLWLFTLQKEHQQAEKD